MPVYDIIFVKEKRACSVSEGTTILEAMRNAGLSLDVPCGGQGTCGKCLVDFSVREGVWETVKACQTRIHSTCYVRTRNIQEKNKILTDGTKREIQADPALRSFVIRIPKCRNGESTSDWTRLCETLQECLRERREFIPDPELASSLSTWIKEEASVEAVICEGYILDARPAENRPLLMAAFDIGTTSVAGYLLDGRTGK